MITTSGWASITLSSNDFTSGRLSVVFKSFSRIATPRVLIFSGGDGVHGLAKMANRLSLHPRTFTTDRPNRNSLSVKPTDAKAVQGAEGLHRSAFPVSWLTSAVVFTEFVQRIWRPRMASSKTRL